MQEGRRCYRRVLLFAVSTGPLEEQAWFRPAQDNLVRRPSHLDRRPVPPQPAEVRRPDLADSTSRLPEDAAWAEPEGVLLEEPLNVSLGPAAHPVPERWRCGSSDHSGLMQGKSVSALPSTKLHGTVVAAFLRGLLET